MERDLRAEEYIKCECGCDKFFVSANDPRPRVLICQRCRKDVRVSGGTTVQITR